MSWLGVLAWIFSWALTLYFNFFLAKVQTKLTKTKLTEPNLTKPIQVQPNQTKVDQTEPKLFPDNIDHNNQ